MKLSLKLDIGLVALVPMLLATQAHAACLDITALTPGTVGAFSGVIDGVAVSGTVSSTNPSLSFSQLGSGHGDSTIDGSFAKYSYCSVYSPCTPGGGTVGYTSSRNGLANAATIVITFSAPVVSPVFQVAGLDSMPYDFSATAGPGARLVLGGNGAGGDGLQVVGSVIKDGDPLTSDVTPPSAMPPTAGARSAYSSVELVGTFSSLTIGVSQNGNGDSGSFTLSAARVSGLGSA